LHYYQYKHVPCRENDLDGEFYVHVRYDMDLMINSNAYEILLIWFVVIFDIYDDFELIDKYRFSRQSIMLICDMLQDDLESSTFRNRAYFFFYVLFT
jgi:hypothetical protein